MSEGAKHSGIVAWFSPLPIRSKPFSPETHPIITVLDGVQDVQNLGAILRSAYCTGVNGIVIPQRNAAPLTGAAHRASAGLAEHLDIWRVSALPEAVSALQDAGYNIYLAVVNGGIDVTTMAFQRPTCLVIGSEEKGISPEVRKRGTLISLPQAEENISYNASVAAGILMFTAVHNK
jgi:23S rRNA (guanosine2251-2'-O)-methyltransferase